MDWENKKVLITGGTGFIGSHLVERLISLKADVALLVLDEENEIPKGVSIVYHGNIQDYPDIERIIGRFQPEYVFHLASQPLVETALISVYDTLDTNIRGAINILQANHAVNKNLAGIVFVSTDKVYGEFDGEVDEEAPLLGVGNPYDVSKVCADQIAQMFSRVFSLPVVIVRSGNVYGIGDKNWDRLIPGNFRKILQGKPPVIRSDGKMTRDFIYVDDIIDGYLLLAEKVKELKWLRGLAVNLGAHKPHTVLEVIDAMLLTCESIHLVPIIENRAVYEIKHQHLNWEFAKELGWEPKTSLESGLLKIKKSYE